ncbi:MAG: DUF309 domain-containing protein [Rhizobacter sp.]|nr:DUF309 domain-containing protein [Chlorobiales bacterium]
MSLDEHTEAFLKGVDEYNRTYFFECHDTWEEIWMETRGPDRKFLHGLIHTAIALYHLENRNHKGAHSQFEKAFTKLESYKPRYRGIDIEKLVLHIQSKCVPVVEQLERGEKPVIDSDIFPKLVIELPSL